jgi:sporulation delaying protein A
MRLRAGPRGLPRTVRRRRSIKTTVAVGVIYAVLLAAAGLSTLVASLPSNILWERTQLSAIRVELNTIAGQDFAFFTRSPETDQIDAYRLHPDGAVGVSLLVTPQTKAENMFGLSRTQRAQGPELANLVRAVRANAWTDCTGLDRTTCIDAVQRRPKAFLHNNSPVPTVCGQVALAVETTTKWAYRRLTETRYTIERIAAANVACNSAR